MIRQLVRVVAACVVVGLLAMEVRAYVLPAEFLLGMLADSRRRMRLKGLAVQMTTEDLVAASSVEERLYLKVPERLRRVREEETATAVLVQKEGKLARGTDKMLKKVSDVPVDLLPVLLMPRGGDVEEARARMMEALKSAGIDVDTVSLGRSGKDLVYVVGAKSWQKDQPQLWLDKGTFMPVRYRIYHGQGSKRVAWETRLLSWGSSAGGNFFPAVVELYVDNKLAARSEIIKVQANDKLPETLFGLPF